MTEMRYRSNVNPGSPGPATVQRHYEGSRDLVVNRNGDAAS
jgi:hypothetical protein